MDKRYGGNVMGVEGDGITLQPGEYFSDVVATWGAWINSLEFKTNLGRVVKGGTPISDHRRELHGIRITALSGWAGAYLDSLKITYVENYKPSKILEQNVQLITAVYPPFEKWHEYTDKTTISQQASIDVESSSFSVDASASVEAEYGATFKAALDVKYSTDSVKTISANKKEILKEGSTKDQSIPGGFVGVRVVTTNIMQSSDGQVWISPAVSSPNLLVLPIKAAAKQIYDSYDLTGAASDQIPGLKAVKTQKYGVTFYATPSKKALK